MALHDKNVGSRPIDKIRNSGGRMTLPEDAGGISEVCEIKGSLHLIGKNAIYRVQLADEIDPQRTNIHIPNTHQQVLSCGTECRFVRQTLMTAKWLFNNNVLGSAFNYKSAINLSFEALQDFSAMHAAYEDLSVKLNKIVEELKNLAAKERTLTVPTAGDVRGLTESFLQKADHVAIDLFNIAKLFYPDGIGQRWFQSLYDLIAKKYGSDDPFAEFMKQALPFLQFVRNARNAMEHPDAAKSVKVTDISLLPSGELNLPCIEILHLETPQPSVCLPTLLGYITDELGSIFESVVACLCGHNVQPFAGLQLWIIEHDENQQKAYKCRYGYGTRIGG